jgi:hypothetical protein
MEGGAAHRNWAPPVAPLAEEGVGEDEGLTRCRFVAGDGWGRAGSWPSGGAPRARLRRPLLRRVSGLERSTGSTDRLYGP